MRLSLTCVKHFKPLLCVLRCAACTRLCVKILRHSKLDGLAIYPRKCWLRKCPPFWKGIVLRENTAARSMDRLDLLRGPGPNAHLPTILWERPARELGSRCTIEVLGNFGIFCSRRRTYVVKQDHLDIRCSHCYFLYRNMRCLDLYIQMYVLNYRTEYNFKLNTCSALPYNDIFVKLRLNVQVESQRFEVFSLFFPRSINSCESTREREWFLTFLSFAIVSSSRGTAVMCHSPIRGTCSQRAKLGFFFFFLLLYVYWTRGTHSELACHTVLQNPVEIICAVINRRDPYFNFYLRKGFSRIILTPWLEV